MKWHLSHRLIAVFLISIAPYILKANDEDEVKIGIAKLNALITQNEINSKLGLSHLNKYVVRLDNQDLTHIRKEKADFIQEDLTQLDNELANLAADYKIHFYILLNGSQLSVGKLDVQNRSVEFGKIDSATAALNAHINSVVVRIYRESKISGLGEGKNLLLSITPVQRVKVDLKDKSKDELYYTYLRKFIPGKSYPELLNILRYRYSNIENVANTLYSKDPYNALKAQKKLYEDVLTAYDEEVEKLYPGNTVSSKKFYKEYISDYQNPSFKKVIDEIGLLIDEDERGFLELRSLMDSVNRLFGPLDVSTKYAYFNKEFTFFKGIGPRADEFEAFKQSILTYREYRQNIIQLASQIQCSPSNNQTKEQFQAKVYYCAALLTPSAASSLSLEVRQNLLCALSSLDLSRDYTVARDQLTTDEGKEEVVVMILFNTPENQRKSLLEYFSNEKLSGNVPVITNLVSELNSKNFQDMMLLLVDWVQQYFPPQKEAWLDILHDPRRDYRAVLPLGTFRDGYSISIRSYGGKTTIAYHITENDIPIKSHRVSAEFLGYVVVKFEAPYSIGGKSFEEGSLHVIPSLMAYLIMHNMKVNSLISAGKYTLYAAGLLVGVTEIIAAKTLLQATIALTDMGVASSDIIINEVLAEDLSKTEDGKKFIDSWNKYVLIYAGGRVVSELSGIADNLNSLAKKINRNDVDDIVLDINNSVLSNLSIVNNLKGSIKSTFDDLLSAGLTYEVKSNSILLKNTSNETVAIIFENKLTPVKWDAYYRYSSKIETSEGYWILHDGKNIYIDIGFKNSGGRRIKAEEVNDYLVNSGRAQREGQPYLNATFVEERVLQKGERFFVIEERAASQPGGWGTKNKILTIKELRNDMAVLQAWKDEANDLVIREYEVLVPIRVREGIIGPQLESTGVNAGMTYKGGGHQYEFVEKKFDLNNPYTKFLRMINETTLIK